MSVGAFGEDYAHFLAADATAAANTTTNLTSQSLDVSRVNSVGIGIYVKGAHAASSGAVTINYQVSIDGTNWVTRPGIAITLDATNFCSDADAIQTLDVTGVNFIKLLSAANTDATHAATVNAVLTFAAR
jgi:hypothetical protein